MHVFQRLHGAEQSTPDLARVETQTWCPGSGEPFWGSK